MTKTYKIEVDCANCAREMEEAAAKISGVQSVTVNFMAQKWLWNSVMGFILTMS